MQLQNKQKRSAIIIIAFNDVDLIGTQISLISRLCMNRYNTDIIIFDNSSNDTIAKKMSGFDNPEINVYYHRFIGMHFNPSESHAYACNMSYKKFSKDYASMLFLDHDCFPIKPFTVEELVSGYIAAGVGQSKTKKYFWPGCLAFNVEALLGFVPNFSISHEHGLDSGGLLHVLIDFFGETRCKFFDERKVLNRGFNDETYPEYAIINDGMFMHFINASGWNKNENNNARIQSLYKILNDLTWIV
jgi:hypothetical protein